MDRFLIAPINTGLETDLRPWLIAEDAFQTMNNAYVFRGRIRKRFGTQLMVEGGTPNQSRLRINVGTTNGSGNLSGTVPGQVFKIGQSFSIGTEVFTVVVTGTPGVMLTTGSSTVHTYNTTSGAFVINGAAATTPVFFYPSTPVMGITVYNQTGTAINNQPTYAFDTQFAYSFVPTSGWVRSGTGTTPQWNGLAANANQNFFWTSNWEGVTGNEQTMFVTNFNATLGTPPTTGDDPIWYFDGTNWVSMAGTGGVNGIYFAPAGGAVHTGPFVQTCRIIVAFKNRLLLLNTIENNGTSPYSSSTNTQYKGRCRFSHNGSPISTNAWYEPNQTDSSGNVADGAGFIDATTDEQIVSAEFIKDRLIVFFERSTWELAYTGNEVLPFVWQKINTELGAQGPFSSVPFDKVILTIGNTGVHACNGANVQRIDNKIPDQVFDDISSVGVTRIAGIRDYYTEMVYWIYPSENENANNVYPNKLLVYNYRDDSWSTNTDCFTALGYFEQESDLVWENATMTWEQATFFWTDWVNQAESREIIAGNPEGFVLVINPDLPRNAPSLQITNITSSSNTTTLVIIDHTLEEGDYIAIENAVNGVPNAIYQVNLIVDSNTITLTNNPNNPFTTPYTGGATAARVSNYNIVSKQWNPYVNKGQNVYLSKIDFAVQKTDSGQVTVDYSPSAAPISMVSDGSVITGTNSIMGNSVLETTPYDPLLVPLEQVQERLWHPIYFQSEGTCIQINIYMNKDQITNEEIAWSDLQIEGLVLNTMPVSIRLQ